MPSSKRLICVIGSSNTDMVVKGARIPAPGETVSGDEFFLFPGGKGANQAVAAARLGGNVRLVACVGEDSFGRESIERFRSEGIDCSFIVTDPVAASGVAMITVDGQGENSIMVVPGANGKLTPEHARSAVQRLPEDAIVLLQLEIPMDTVETALAEAHARGLTVILNPAPARAIPEHWFSRVSVITPNETEAEAIGGLSVDETDTLQLVSDRFHRAGTANVIITLGSRGAWISDGTASGIIPSQPVDVMDTTGAGDCFSGALAVAMAEGKDLRDAVHFACAAATLSVTRMGAQPSMPVRSRLDEFIAHHS